jgi:hypothetical protein
MVTVAGIPEAEIFKYAGMPPGSPWLTVTSGTTNQNSVSDWEYTLFDIKELNAIINGITSKNLFFIKLNLIFKTSNKFVALKCSKTYYNR